MKLTNEGLSMWYGTPDAPAPLDEIVPRNAASLVVGVHPANPTNAVNVRYRVDGSAVRTVGARALKTDYARQVQYFSATFPPLPVGDSVEYCPVFSCAGRQVPASATPERFPTKFRLATQERASAEPRPSPSVTCGQEFSPTLEFLATVRVRLDKPLFLGETPDGVRIDLFALDGTVVGPRLNGRVLHGSSAHLLVRSDGVGMARVRTGIVTHDGATLDLEDTGSVEFGTDGYRRAIASDLPSHSELVICPRVLTGHTKYLWLNRLRCLGAGRIRLDEQIIDHDLFAARLRTLGPSRRTP